MNNPPLTVYRGTGGLSDKVTVNLKELRALVPNITVMVPTMNVNSSHNTAYTKEADVREFIGREDFLRIARVFWDCGRGDGFTQTMKDMVTEIKGIEFADEVAIANLLNKLDDKEAIRKLLGHAKSAESAR